MKKIIPVPIFFLIFTSFMSLNAQWAKIYGGSSTELAYLIQQTIDGGYVIAGMTGSFGAESGDIWILKLNLSGDIEWQHTYGGSGFEEAVTIQQTSDGGYIAAGRTGSFGAGEYDGWILKLDSSGDIEWQHTYGGSGDEEVVTIQQTSDGGYIAVAYTESFGAGELDAWILKLDSSGDIEWQHTYGGSGDEEVLSIQQTNDGGYIAAGRSDSFGTGECDFWIIKLNSSGDIEWQRTYGGELCERAYAIQITSDGGYVITGCTDSFGTGEDNVWILKLNSSGDIEWQRAYGGSDSYMLYSIQQTRDGGYVVAGNDWFSSFPDIWILKLSSFGDIEWQRTYGGYNIDYARSIQQTNEGGYIIAGYTYLLGSGSSDLLILKLGPTGDIPSCAIVGSSDATVSDTSVSPSDTSVTPMDTNITPLITDILPQESDAIVYNLCPGPHTLTLSATVGGTTDPEPGTYAYDGAEMVTIRAISDSGYSFVGWTGDASGTHNSIPVTMDSDKSITANFTTISTGKKDGCFIATAAYGSSLHPYVKILRDFKNKYLMPSKFGQALVDLYYKYSPSVADFIRKHKVLKVAVRINLLPVIAFSYSVVHLGPIATAVILAFILVLPIFFIWFYPRRLRILELIFEKGEK